jgi:hypothetical protein
MRGGWIAVVKAMVYRAIAQNPAQCVRPKTVIKARFSRRSKTQTLYLLLIHRLAVFRTIPPNMAATFGAATLSQRSLICERLAFFPRRALQLLGWYAILVESSGLSVARRSTKTNQNLNHDLRFRLDRCLADPSRNHLALRHRITSATRQTP